MANRPVFLVREAAPYYSVFNADFVWSKGLALSQKRKNIDAIHKRFEMEFPKKRVLEISSKSTMELGVSAGAFNLKKAVKSINAEVPVENIYQSSKVFTHGGPYTDLLNSAPMDAKRDERLKTSGKLVSYSFEGTEYPLVPFNAFYDYIYIKALIENPLIGDGLMDYSGFTDIAFTPAKGLNCQARSAAIYVSLRRLGQLESVNDFGSFALLFEGDSSYTAIIRKG